MLRSTLGRRRRGGDAPAADGQSTNRATRVDQLQQEYRDLGAYADITPGDGQTTTYTPAQPPAAPTCANGTVIPNPAANRELVKDCETLLAARDTLRGTATLNWATGTALTSWTGITTGGTPTRVTGLSLASTSLTGSIPAAIGRLFALTTLNLSSNSLTGDVPAELGWLEQLTELRLSGNSLTGCIPLTLKTVTTNDLSALNLPDCIPPAFAEASYSFTVAEDAAVGTQLGTVRATVAGGAAVTHTLSAGNRGGVWTIDAATGELKVEAPLDYEAAPTHTLTVTADAGVHGTATATVTVTVTNVDEPPAFAAASYAFSVAGDALAEAGSR